MSSSPKENKHDDPTGTGHKHRWECPAGHRSWERINDHVWCHACSRECTHNPEADPEWYELRDTGSGELVDIDDLLEKWPDFSEVPAY